MSAVAAVSSADPAPPRSVPTRSARRTVGPLIRTGHTPMRAGDPTVRGKIPSAWALATLRSTARAPLLSRSGEWAMTAIADQTRDELEKTPNIASGHACGKCVRACVGGWMVPCVCAQDSALTPRCRVSVRAVRRHSRMCWQDAMQAYSPRRRSNSLADSHQRDEGRREPRRDRQGFASPQQGCRHTGLDEPRGDRSPHRNALLPHAHGEVRREYRQPTGSDSGNGGRPSAKQIQLNK